MYIWYKLFINYPSISINYCCSFILLKVFCYSNLYALFTAIKFIRKDIHILNLFNFYSLLMLASKFSAWDLLPHWVTGFWRDMTHRNDHPPNRVLKVKKSSLSDHHLQRAWKWDLKPNNCWRQMVSKINLRNCSFEPLLAFLFCINL